jgi:abortive infection bacteriophage resistance protein
MLFNDEIRAYEYLKNISYYRLKGYWRDEEHDPVLHVFFPGVYFENIIERYDFDRKLRIILFDAVEQIEIALRTGMIYHLSIAYGGFYRVLPVVANVRYVPVSVIAVSYQTGRNVTL